MYNCTAFVRYTYILLKFRSKSIINSVDVAEVRSTYLLLQIVFLQIQYNIITKQYALYYIVRIRHYIFLYNTIKCKSYQIVNTT